MADIQFSVTSKHGEFYSRTIYRGTREQLLASGVCTPAHFPSGKKRAAYGWGQGGSSWDMRAVKGGTWVLTINAGREEREQRARARARLDEARSAVERAPKSAAAGLALICEQVDMSLALLRRELTPQRTNFGAPYQVDEHTLRLVDSLLARVQLAVNNAAPVRNEQLWEELQSAARHDEPTRPVLRAPLTLVKAA